MSDIQEEQKRLYKRAEENDIKEIWKSVVGFEGSYEVSNLGNVRSIDRYCIQKNNFNEKYNHIYKGKILKQFKNNAGYKQVQLSFRYKSIPKRVHRLVAEAFLDNPNNYKCVNHIDGNKENNNVNNLEWCSYSHNNMEARKLGLNKGWKGMTYKKRCQLAIEYINNIDNMLTINVDGQGRIFIDEEGQNDLLNILKGDNK
jgi:hypothetical protein